MMDPFKHTTNMLLVKRSLSVIRAEKLVLSLPLTIMAFLHSTLEQMIQNCPTIKFHPALDTLKLKTIMKTLLVSNKTFLLINRKHVISYGKPSGTLRLAPTLSLKQTPLINSIPTLRKLKPKKSSAKVDVTKELSESV